MTNATTGPVAGQPYAVIVLVGGFDIERFNFSAPTDALLCAIDYLRAGRQARLSDRTCAALREAPEMAHLDGLLQMIRHSANGTPVTDLPLPAFRAAGNA